MYIYIYIYIYTHIYIYTYIYIYIYTYMTKPIVLPFACCIYSLVTIFIIAFITYIVLYNYVKYKRQITFSVILIQLNQCIHLKYLEDQRNLKIYNEKKPKN